MSDRNKEKHHQLPLSQEIARQNEAFYEAALKLVEKLHQTGSGSEALDLQNSIHEAQKEMDERTAAGGKEVRFQDILVEVHGRRPFFLMKALVFALEGQIDAEEEKKKINRDPVTDANTDRREYLQKIHSLIEEYMKSGMDFSLIYIDMNNLKFINDSLGHQKGDEALKVLYDTIHASLRAGMNDEIYRMGNKSDEFVVVTTADMTGALKIVERAFTELKGMNERTSTRGLRLPITASAGIASISQIIPDRTAVVDQVQAGGLLIDSADQAMIRAKKRKISDDDRPQSPVEIHGSGIQ